MSNWLKITPDSDFSFFLALLEVFLSILSSCGFLSSSFLIRFTGKIESIFYTPQNSSIQKIDQAIVHALDSLTHCERNSNMTNSRKYLSSGFTSGFCVKILTLIYVQKLTSSYIVSWKNIHKYLDRYSLVISWYSCHNYIIKYLSESESGRSSASLRSATQHQPLPYLNLLCRHMIHSRLHFIDW
jgi:hypothetical protein